jgi:hypothetical protein
VETQNENILDTCVFHRVNLYWLIRWYRFKEEEKKRERGKEEKKRREKNIKRQYKTTFTMHNSRGRRRKINLGIKQ